MSVYAIAQGRIDNREKFAEYVAGATPTLQAHQVKILSVDESPTVVEGKLEYPRTVILEFKSEQAFHDWYDSPAYRAARALREDASEGNFILVQGL